MTIQLRKLFIISALILGGLLAFFIFSSSENNSNFSLAAPSFVTVAQAAEENAAISTIQETAGISAYFNANSIIDLSRVRDSFQTIEIETDDYILGEIALEDYPENHAPQVYVHVDGWFMAYYPDEDPAAKILDWEAFRDSDDSIMTTKLEKVIIDLVNSAGLSGATVSYYDFRYPNATSMMLILERGSLGGGFLVNIPSSFSVNERSWSTTSRFFYLNGTELYDSSLESHNLGFINSTDMRVNMDHNLNVSSSTGYGGLVLIYLE